MLNHCNDIMIYVVLPVCQSLSSVDMGNANAIQGTEEDVPDSDIDVSVPLSLDMCVCV